MAETNDAPTNRQSTTDCYRLSLRTYLQLLPAAIVRARPHLGLEFALVDGDKDRGSRAAFAVFHALDSHWHARKHVTANMLDRVALQRFLLRLEVNLCLREVPQRLLRTRPGGGQRFTILSILRARGASAHPLRSAATVVKLLIIPGIHQNKAKI